MGGGPIIREPQGDGATWSNYTVPFGSPTTTPIPTSGETNTMSWIGCAVTCYSMIDSTKGDPGVMDSILSKASKIWPHGNLKFREAANLLGYTTQWVYNFNDLDIVDALCGKGSYPGANYVIAEVKYSGGHQHYVVITGQTFNPDPNVESCDFTIADPASYPNSNTPGPFTFLSQYGGVTGTSALLILTK
jgi:hypothetical protein